MLVQFLPPSRVMYTRPSSEPVQMVFDVLARGRDGENGAVDFGTVLVVGDRAARIAQRFGIGARQVGADLLPALAVVGGLPEMLRGRVENVRDRPAKTRSGRSTASAPSASRRTSPEKNSG